MKGCGAAWRSLIGAMIGAVAGFQALTEAHPQGAAGRDAAGESAHVADQAQPDRIRIAYDPPKDPKHQLLYQRLQENRVLETLQEMLGPIVLPVDLTIRTKGCDGLSVSWYDTPNVLRAPAKHHPDHDRAGGAPGRHAT
jgi:hypothetical protein